MYREFYGINKKPFQISADPEFLWLGPKHKEGLSVLFYGVRDNKGFLVLSGGVGTGKTTLIHALHEKLDDSVVVASVPDPGLKQIEFYQFIAASFGMEGRYQNKVDFILAFEKFLKDVHAQGRVALLIIDEAQRLSSAMLEEVRLLSNIETPKQKLLNIFFVGQEEFYEVIATPQNRALRQRVTINYHLDTLSLEETRMLIAHRLKVAGATKPIFNDEAIAGIYSCSKGHPRRINILCDHALLTGFVKNCPTIGADIISECSMELALPGESLGLRRPSAVATGSLARGTHQVESKTAETPTPPAPAIPEDFVANEAPKPAAPRRENHRRMLMIATTICLSVLAAVLFFKLQDLPISPSKNAILAAAPSEGTAQAETTTPELNVAVSSSPVETMSRPEVQKDLPGEVPADSESISIVPMEQTATKEPQEETFATAAQTPERPDRPENDIAVVPPPPGSDTALAEVGASTITVDDTPEAPADERFRPERTIEDTLPSTIENSERDTVDRPTPTTQVRAQEQQASLEDPDDLRFATATPESTGFPLETAANNEATATAIPDESNRSADQALSAPAPDLPEVTQTGVLPPTPRPVSTPVKPIKSETAATGAQEQLTDRPAALERTDRPAPAKSAANPPERPRPESVPPTPEPKQPAAPKKVARKPLVAATTAKAPLKDDALKSPTTAEKLQDFLKTYCRLYSSKDVDRFAALFTPDAIERDRPFADLIPVYRANFAKLNDIRYQIDLKNFTESANSREILIKGNYLLVYRLKGEDFKMSGGTIEMNLIKRNNGFRIERLDYRKGK